VSTYSIGAAARTSRYLAGAVTATTLALGAAFAQVPAAHAAPAPRDCELPVSVAPQAAQITLTTAHGTSMDGPSATYCGWFRVQYCSGGVMKLPVAAFDEACAELSATPLSPAGPLAGEHVPGEGHSK
jgi:hypothetical protein